MEETRAIADLLAGAATGVGELRGGCDRCGAGAAATGRLRLRWVLNCASALGLAAGIADGTDDAAIGRLSTIVDITAIDGTLGALAREAVEAADDAPATAATPASAAVGFGSRSRISRADRGRFSTSLSSALVITLSVCNET